MKIVYNFGSIALIGACVFAGLNAHIFLAIIYFLASMAFLLAANLEHLIKDEAPRDCFEIEARELIKKTEITISGMQNLAKLVSRTALSLIKRSGRSGGYPEEEQETLKESFLDLLSSLNLSDEDRENVLEEYNKFIEIDYVLLLLGSHIAISWPKEELHKRREILKHLADNCPPPHQIEELLTRNGSLSSNHKEILEDFEYFHKHKRYRRPEILSKHNELRKIMNL